MDSVYQILIGFTGAALLALLTRYILVRRICVVTQKFPIAQLGGADDLAVLLTSLNRGYRNEDDIRIELNPKRSYTLVAQTGQGVHLEGCVLRIERLPRLTDIAAILIVGGGEFSGSDLARVHSKEGAGRVFSKLEEVPYPPGQAAGMALLLLSLLGSLAWMGLLFVQTIADDKLPKPLKSAEAIREEALREQGWHDLLILDNDRILSNYRIDEYPVTLRVLRRERALLLVEAIAINHTPDNIESFASVRSDYSAPAGVVTNSFWSAKLSGGGIDKGLLKIYLPSDPADASVDIHVSIKGGSDSAVYAVRTVRLQDVN